MRKASQLVLFAVSAVFGLFASANAWSAEGLNVGGFADAQFRWQNKGGLGEGFIINDGAVYLSKMMGNTEVKVDLPFVGRTAGSNILNFASGKAQAYVSHKYDQGFRWKLGQFDRIYGLEANDTVDVAFTRQGLIEGGTTLTSTTGLMDETYTGLLVGYDVMKTVSIQAMVSNPANQGTMNQPAATPAVVGKPVYGAQISYNDMIRLTAGMKMTKAGTETLTMFDFIVGGNVGALALDAEVVLNKEAATGAAAVAGAANTSALGLLVQGVYGINEEWSAGVRGEMVSKRQGQPDQKAMLLTVGPQYSFNKDMKVKFDYSYGSERLVAAGDATKTHQGGLAVVHKF